MKKKLANLLLALIACLFAAFGFVACGENPLAVTAPTNVRVDAGTMSVAWDKVEGAAKYTISINDGTEYSITNTSYVCSQLIQSNQTFTVKVCAVSSVGDMKSEATVMTFSPLDKITDLALTEEGSLTWSVVNNATGYAIRVDGVEQQVPLAVTEYAIETTGRHSYQVRPVGADNSFYSVWSDVKQVTKLGTVDASKIKYNVEKGKLSWASVSGANAYEVYVNGFVEAENCTATTLDFDCPNANFIVEIKAKSNAQDTLAGEMCEQKEFIFLNPVTNVRVADGVLLWDEVEGATSYRLKIGNATPKTITGTSYDKLQRGTSLTVSLMPISDDAVYFSNWTQPMSFYLLEAPVIQWDSSLKLDDGSAKNNIYWDGITNAHGYELRIVAPNGDESIEPASATDRQFAYDFLEVGTYTVELKATADPDDSTFCDSPYSTKIEVIRLASPTQVSSGFITSKPQELSKGFTVSFEKVAKATGYRLYKEGTAIMDTPSSTSQFKVNNVADGSVIDETTYDYAVQSIGTDAMQNKTVVLSSLKDKSLDFSITVLAVPQSPTIKGFTYEYGEIGEAHTTGYAVSAGAKVYDVNDVKFDLGTVLPAGNADIKVCAKGNGANVLASNYSEIITVHRLEAPYNIRISEPDAGEMKLECAPITGADSYNFVLDNNNMVGDTDEYVGELLRELITTNGTSLHMIAVSNQFKEGVYYMTSHSSETKKFMRLATPTFGTKPFSNTQLTWNHPSNINTNSYTPNYEIYNANNIKYNGEKSGNSMNIEYLDGGAEYKFKVKALGDGVNYINSDVSETVAIYKLASPQIQIVNNEYQWESVSDADSYAVYIDGGNTPVKTFEHVPNKVYSYKPSFNELKTYQVEVIAVGDGTSTINSKQVEGKNLILQQTAVLTVPDFALSYSHTAVNEQGVLTVTITTESPYATGYYYTLGGVGEPSANTTFTKKLWKPDVYKVSVYALGGGFDEAGVYYLNSPSQGGGSDPKYMITLLNKPEPGNMALSEDKVFTWKDIDNASFGYTVEISVNNGAWQTITTMATQNRIDKDVLKTYLNGATTVKFRVRANGNGSNVIEGQTAESQLWNLA